VFQPFTQADASTARRFGGTGLGLTICSSLVRLMGGRIWAQSEPGQGSTFCFSVQLPLAKELPTETKMPDVPTAAASRLRILLVEDNPANQKLAAYILGERGHTVDIAGDGRKALRMAAEECYDIILMDVQMPGMDGLEATAVLRKRENGHSRLPIIAMTAHAMKGDRDRCLAAGMDGYLAKPINAQELIGLVEGLGGRKGFGIRNSELEEETQPTTADPAPLIPNPQSLIPVYDPELAIKRCFNKPKMVADMIEYFFADVDALFPQMREALKKGNLREVGRLGHRLKGTVVYLGAAPATEAARAVEKFDLYDGEPAEAAQAISALQRQCEVLKAALAVHQAASAAQAD
jgi:CheY-like chemotaxis protein